MVAMDLPGKIDLFDLARYHVQVWASGRLVAITGSIELARSMIYGCSVMSRYLLVEWYNGAPNRVYWAQGCGEGTTPVVLVRAKNYQDRR